VDSFVTLLQSDTCVNTLECAQYVGIVIISMSKETVVSVEPCRPVTDIDINPTIQNDRSVRFFSDFIADRA